MFWKPVHITEEELIFGADGDWLEGWVAGLPVLSAILQCGHLPSLLLCFASRAAAYTSDGDSQSICMRGSWMGQLSSPPPVFTFSSISFS